MEGIVCTPTAGEELLLCGLWNLMGMESWGGLQSSSVNCGRCLAGPFDFRDRALEQRGQTSDEKVHSGNFINFSYLF